MDLEDKLLSIAAATVGGDVSEVDELAVVPLHNDALPLELPAPPHLRSHPISSNFPSHHLSWIESSPPFDQIPPSPRYAVDDGNNDCEGKRADDGGLHGVGVGGVGGACECGESV